MSNVLPVKFPVGRVWYLSIITHSSKQISYAIPPAHHFVRSAADVQRAFTFSLLTKYFRIWISITITHWAIYKNILTQRVYKIIEEEKSVNCLSNLLKLATDGA